MKGRVAWLRPALRIAVLGLGGVHAWVAVRQQAMNEDGISYLDMGDACVSGDWGMALNAVWSPLYACLLGAVHGLLDPGMARELALTHAVNFVIFAFALLAFEWFWFRSVAPLRPGAEPAAEVAETATIGFPEWAWTLIGYALFAWIALDLVRVWAVTPDMLMAGLLFLAAGLWVRTALPAVPVWTPLALGTMLGLAYLAKAVMFPLAFVFLALLLATGPLRRTAGRAGLALAAFLLVAGPWALALSLDKGRATFGEAGRLTYVRYVSGVPYPHWRTEAAPGTVEPSQATRRIFSDPAIFEFGSPIGGTYPPGFDPSYWYEGVSPGFRPARQAAALARSAAFYFDLFIRILGGPVAVVALLLIVGRFARRTGRSSLARWGPGLAALAALAAYALVYVEGRYVGAFLVLLAASALSAVRLPDGALSRRALTTGAVLVVFFLGLQLAAFHIEEGAPTLGLSFDAAPEAALSGEPAEAPREDPAGPVELGRAAAEAGLGPGDEVAFIGYAFGATFARLARLRIVAEVPWEEMETFWGVEASRRRAALRALERTGARAVIAEWAPGDTVPGGWERLGSTRHLLYRFPGAVDGALPKDRARGNPPRASARRPL